MPGSAIAGTSRTASPAPVHPLRLPPSPVAASEAAFAASSSLIPPPASPSGGVRSRRGTPLQGQQHQHQYQPNRIEADVTRPSLKRIVSSATTIVPASNEGAQSRASLDELSRTGKEGLAEREIIIHELLKTDTIASISLQYGITPQALRTSNRLWPSDSIHLRRTLNIPLDQCHLPSATSGFERLVREEDGNIVVWQRSPPSPNGSTGGILSPTARRKTSASAFELGESPNTSTADLIGLWATGSSASASTADDSARSSFDLPDEPPRGVSPSPGHMRYSTTGGGYHEMNGGGGGGKGKGRGVDSPAPYLPEDDAVANYLSNTHNPYSSHSSSPAPLLSFSPSPTPSAEPPPPPDPSLSPSTSTSSRASSSLAPPSPMHAHMQKKTLLISRVPSSTLSFFPPSSAANSALSESSPRMSSEEDSRPPVSASSNGGGRKGSFFGPLANSLARLNLSSPSSSSGVGPIALGLGGSGWSSSSSLNGETGSTPTPTASGRGGGGGWDLSYFAGEEDEGGGEVNPWAGMASTVGRTSGRARGRGRGKMKD